MVATVRIPSAVAERQDAQSDDTLRLLAVAGSSSGQPTPRGETGEGSIAGDSIGGGG
jgi:hypothetical protein